MIRSGFVVIWRLFAVRLWWSVEINVGKNQANDAKIRMGAIYFAVAFFVGINQPNEADMCALDRRRIAIFLPS